MKNLITRALAIAMLTTSLSAFGMSEKPKTAQDTDSTTTNSNATLVIYVVDAYVVDEANTVQEEAQPDQNDEKSRKHQLIEQQDKQWLHDVQNLIAG